MRTTLFAAAALLLLAFTTFAQTPPVVSVAAAGKPNYISVDQIVLNLNAVAGINYNADTSGNSGTVTVTYLNGYTGTYSVKLNATAWAAIQAQIVANGNK